MAEPMTDERLAEIRAAIEWYERVGDKGGHALAAELLDEVARLRDDRDAARADAARVRAVVDAARAYRAAEGAWFVADDATIDAREREAHRARDALFALLMADDAAAPGGDGTGVG